MDFFQQVINGLALGSVYALIALGYTMVYGIIGLINFAHGDIYMVGAYLGFVAATQFNLPFIPALLIAMIGSALLGVIIEKVAYKPLRNSQKITLLITAIAVSLLLENGFGIITNQTPSSYPHNILPRTIIHFGRVQISLLQLIILLLSAALAIVLQLIVFKTKVGKAMRATSYDMDAAKLMGINSNNIISFTFAIGSALAGAAGVFVGALYGQIGAYMGIMPGLKAFIAAVLGGIGVIPGAMLGGILMGLIETFTKVYINPKLADAIVFGILIVILLVKPSGILGKKTREKV